MELSVRLTQQDLSPSLLVVVVFVVAPFMRKYTAPTCGIFVSKNMFLTSEAFGVALLALLFGSLWNNNLCWERNIQFECFDGFAFGFIVKVTLLCRN